MITDAILTFFRGLVDVVLGWLPNPTPPNLSSDLSGFADAFRWYGWANEYIPLNEMFGFFAVGLAVYSGMWLFRAAVWVLTKAHILGGSSD